MRPDSGADDHSYLDFVGWAPFFEINCENRGQQGSTSTTGWLTGSLVCSCPVESASVLVQRVLHRLLQPHPLPF